MVGGERQSCELVRELVDSLDAAGVVKGWQRLVASLFGAPTSLALTPMFESRRKTPKRLRSEFDRFRFTLAPTADAQSRGSYWITTSAAR